MNNVKHYFSQNTNALLYFQLLTTMQCMYFQHCDEIFYATCEVKNQHLHTFFITIILAAFPFHTYQVKGLLRYSCCANFLYCHIVMVFLKWPCQQYFSLKYFSNGETQKRNKQLTYWQYSNFFKINLKLPPVSAHSVVIRNICHISELLFLHLLPCTETTK